jgi:hypothetical protein
VLARSDNLFDIRTPLHQQMCQQQQVAKLRFAAL